MEQGVQPATGSWPQTPPMQVSVVQALPSLQSEGSEQGTQPGMGSCEQPAAPWQPSTVQALPSSQRALPPSSTWPLQSLSTPSQISAPPEPMSRSALPVVCIELTPQALATFV